MTTPRMMGSVESFEDAVVSLSHGPVVSFGPHDVVESLDEDVVEGDLESKVKDLACRRSSSRSSGMGPGRSRRSLA